MPNSDDLIEKLTTLNQISDTLNQAVDVRSVLDDTLARLVELMGLETGWIILQDPQSRDLGEADSFALAAHYNLPPALSPDNASAWEGTCACRELAATGDLTNAYNEVYCSRLSRAGGDSRGLAVHASALLHAGDRVLGMLNVAAADWGSFSPQALSLLTNVGSQLGIALERAQLFDLVRDQRWHEQESLLGLSRQLLSHLDLSDLIEHVVHEVRRLLSADAAALLLPSDQPGFLEFRATSGWHHDPGIERRQVVDDERTGPGQVMRSHQAQVVADIRVHGANWMPNWLEAEGFVAYAIVPLTLNGDSLGVLMLNQREARSPQSGEVRFLQLMANQAAMAIDKARLHEEEVKMKVLEKDLVLGQQIQMGLLPDGTPSLPDWEFAAFYQAAREVGGDFYDFIELPGVPRRLGMLIADVAGKGVPAALFMARGSTLIRTTALARRSPKAVLSLANKLMLQGRKADLFLTAFYAVLDTATGRLDYANAGHNPPLWFHRGATAIQELRAEGIVLGIFGEIELEEQVVEVEAGDYLVFYTDGVTEAMDANHVLFGQDRLEAAIRDSEGASAQEMLDAIVATIRAFTGEIPQSDDLTLFVVRRAAHHT
jgi:sigma-B regulation protein RsbU (phosphoserine phosphatase)